MSIVLSEQEIIRRESLQQLRALGINPYPAEEYKVTAFAQDIADNFERFPETYKNVTMAGYQMLVRGDIFRGRYRNSYEKPEAFEPGRITEVKYTLPDVGHTFKKGHRIMIQVQNSWFPLSDRNPQTYVDIYKAKDSDFKAATMRIFHDKEAPSSVKVTVLQE